MRSNLLLTKLYRPTVPTQVVQRPYLYERLNQGLTKGNPLTLVSAPAGFGKTTLITTWLDSVTLPFSWLSLDALDDDPRRFFAYFIAALQKIAPHLGQEIDGILRAGQLPPNEIISTTLLNDLLANGQKMIVVLDDFQFIQDETILQALQTIVTNLPHPLHLILLTREEPSLPLARLRANNQLTEVRAADLRFELQETAVFLNEMMGLQLSKTELNTLAEKTEGWVVGLQLAGLSMRDRANPATFIADLSGTHRHILSYLTEEVLSQQPKDVQSFLLQTSILEQLNGDLCDAVTEGKNGRILLETLYNDNLFLVPLDDEQQWYRYHQLFADLLRDRQRLLHREQTAVLHQRASQWFAQQGFFSEAIGHALDAHDYETAVTLIETHAMDLLLAWHARTIKQWMQLIPSEWEEKSPKTNLMFAWMYLMSNNFTQALPYIDRLQKMFATDQLDETDPAIRAEWLALQANLLSAQGQPEQSLAVGQQALAIVPDDDDHVRALIYSGLATSYIQMNDREGAIEAYQKLIQYGRSSGNLVSELMGISGLGLFAIQRGELQFAFTLAAQGIESVERSGIIPPISSAVYGEMGSIYYQWYQLEKAKIYLMRSAQVSKFSGFSDAEVFYHVILSRLAQMEGDLETAVQEIEIAEQIKLVEAPTAVQEELIAQQVRIALAQNDFAKAATILNARGFSLQTKLAFPPLLAAKQLNHPIGLLYNSALRVILHQANPSHLQRGLELANQLISEAREGQFVPLEIETRLIRAQLLHAMGDESGSQNDLYEALSLAQPEKHFIIFIEEGEPIARLLAHLNVQEAALDAFRNTILRTFPTQDQPRSHHLPSNDLVESLSYRELEILQLIGEGLTNQEIAERLVITLHTVKKHSSNIYSKLGVRSRTQAIAKARDLQLLA